MSDESEQSGGAPASPGSRWQRLGDRVRSFMFKQVDGGPNSSTKAAVAGPTSVDEIEAAIKHADDKERLVGLLMAPIAAMIGILVTTSLINNDPKAVLANGEINRLHVSPNLYAEVGGVAVVLALAMLVTAWYRKRLFLGIAMALYGLSIFNLHFWGFGVPYIMAGAWLLVRAYRLQQKLKLAKADGLPQHGSPTLRAQPNKRYTPPSVPPRRAPKAKPGKELEAG